MESNSSEIMNATVNVDCVYCAMANDNDSLSRVRLFRISFMLIGSILSIKLNYTNAMNVNLNRLAIIRIAESAVSLSSTSTKKFLADNNNKDDNKINNNKN